MVQAITTISGIPAIPAIQIQDKNLQGMLDALKESVEVLTGARGDPNSRALTYGEATENGLTDLFVTNRVVETAQGSQQSVTLTGDITGIGIFSETGTVTVPTIIALPNVVCIDGGTASETYPGAVTGPYGVAVAAETPVAPTGEYCPGHTYTYLSPTTWRVTGVDATKLFRVGRRLHFIEGDNDYYGTITVSVYSASNTNLTMSMDTGSLTASVTEVCMTTGATGIWDAIVADPFSGGRINSIATGQIGATQWWVIVGNTGKLATSTDAGLTWTLRTLTTTEHLNTIAYDHTNEEFWVGGDAGVIVDSADGTTWSEDTTSIPGLGGTGNHNVVGIIWNSTNAAVEIYYKDTVSNYRSAATTDGGTTWTDYATLGQFSFNDCLEPARASAGNTTGAGKYTTTLNNTSVYVASSHTDTSWSISYGAGTGNIVSAMAIFHDGTGQSVVLGAFNGNITGSAIWTGDQTDGLFTDPINHFAWSDTHQRLVCVGDNGTIGYQDLGDKENSNAWTSVTGGFSPIAEITSVEWNTADGIFVAVAADGAICRSSTGIGPTVDAVTHDGFTLIASDPFSGGQINRIISGVIAGTVWWVAIGDNGKLYTSTDKGVTWTVRTTSTTANLLSIGYNSTDEQFVVGAVGGEFLDSTNGTTWTRDNTTIAALGHSGVDDVWGIVWSPTDALWHWIIHSNPGTAMRTYTTTNAVTTFTSRDIGIVFHAGGSSKLQATGNVIAWTSTEDTQYHIGATDTTDSVYASFADASDMMGHGFAAGTGSFTHDYIVGKADGNTYRMGSTTGGATTRHSAKPHSDTWRGFDSSTIGTKRWIGVGDNGQMWTVETAFFESGKWEEIIDPFTAHIRDVHYNATDAYWIAVGSNGQIARSPDGIS